VTNTLSCSDGTNYNLKKFYETGLGVLVAKKGFITMTPVHAIEQVPLTENKTIEAKQFEKMSTIFIEKQLLCF
jgi:hypothetical protein